MSTRPEAHRHNGDDERRAALLEIVGTGLSDMQIVLGLMADGNLGAAAELSALDNPNLRQHVVGNPDEELKEL
jgi:hypothetical protein